MRRLDSRTESVTTASGFVPADKGIGRRARVILLPPTPSFDCPSKLSYIQHICTYVIHTVCLFVIYYMSSLFHYMQVKSVFGMVGMACVRFKCSDCVCALDRNRPGRDCYASQRWIEAKEREQIKGIQEEIG